MEIWSAYIYPALDVGHGPRAIMDRPVAERGPRCLDRGAQIGRPRRLHSHQSDNWRIGHRLNQPQQRLAGGRGHRVGFLAQLVGEGRVLDDRTFIVPAGTVTPLYLFLAGDTFTQSNRNIQMVKVGTALPVLGREVVEGG